MNIQTFETQFRNSEHFKDITNLIKNNYYFNNNKSYFYNTEFISSHLEILLKIIFNYINRTCGEDTYFLIIDKFTIVKNILKDIATGNSDNKQLVEDTCSTIDNLLYAYTQEKILDKDPILDKVNEELKIASIQYKIGRMEVMITYGVWREYYNFGKLPYTYHDKPVPYPYTAFMRILLSRKYLKLRNELYRQIYKLIDSLNLNDSEISSREISDKILKILKLFINKHHNHITYDNDALNELTIFLSNAFLSALNEENADKNTLLTISEIRRIFEFISWNNIKNELLTLGEQYESE